MVSFTSSIVALAVAAVASAQSGGSTINTPTSLIQCQPIAISWSAGAGGPYFVSVIPGGDPSGATIEQLGGDSFPAGTTSYTWTVDIPAGTSITLKVIDKSGVPNYSQQVTVQPGSSSCKLVSVNGAAASAGSTTAASAGSTTAAAAATTTKAAASTTSAMATTVRGSSTSAGASSTTSAAAAAATTSRAAGGASNLAVGSGFLAAAAAVVAAVL